MSLANTLKYERIKRGMTQEQFAKFLGISRVSIAYYELGRNPAPSRIKILSEKLDLDLAKILLKEIDDKSEIEKKSATT